MVSSQIKSKCVDFFDNDSHANHLRLPFMTDETKSPSKLNLQQSFGFFQQNVEPQLS